VCVVHHACSLLKDIMSAKLSVQLSVDTQNSATNTMT
jgi:hypothetical protein